MQDWKGRQGQPPQHGVTLVEQIMVLAIIAVLVTIAAPPFDRMLRRNRVQAAQLDYIAGLRQARASAVTRGVSTIFCPSRDGMACDETNVWDAGWLSAVDADRDNQPDSRPSYTGGSRPERINVRSSSGRDHVRFRPDGSAPGSNLTLLLCQPGKPDHVLSVVVANSGRVRGAKASTAQAEDCASSS